MKKINKIAFFIFTCLTLSNVPTYGFYYSDDPGANVFGNAATGAAIGGIAGGGRGAAIGAGVGLGLGAMSSAAARNRRRRDDDYYYRRRDDNRNYRSERNSRPSRSRQRRLEDENADLRRRLQEYEN
jgi:hypothetical protein